MRGGEVIRVVDWTLQIRLICSGASSFFPSSGAGRWA
jgi:hypothetical protein